jgi:hypothetical protein
MISIEIANLEINLAELLASLLHIDPHFGRLIYFTPTTSGVRLRILQNVVQDHIMDKTEGRRHLDNIIKTSRRKLDKRNEYIHNAWGTHRDYPTRVVTQSLPQREHKPPRLVPLNELMNLLTDIRDPPSPVKAG